MFWFLNQTLKLWSYSKNIHSRRKERRSFLRSEAKRCPPVLKPGTKTSLVLHLLVLLHMWILYQAFWGSRGGCMQSDTLHPVLSISGSVALWVMQVPGFEKQVWSTILLLWHYWTHCGQSIDKLLKSKPHSWLPFRFGECYGPGSLFCVLYMWCCSDPSLPSV